MKKIILKLVVSTTLLATLINCQSEKSVSKAKKQELKVSVFNGHNLNWVITNNENVKAYQVKLNDLIIEDNVVQTVIDEENSIIEFNKPSTTFEISETLLNEKESNNVSIIAIYNDGREIESEAISL